MTAVRYASTAALDWRLELDDTQAFTWGWPWLVRRLGPARAGSMLIVGARDGVGKSFLLLHIGHEVARAGQHATYISLEDPKSEVFPRLQTGLAHPNLDVVFVTGGSLRETMDAMGEAPGIVLVDYLQEIHDDTGGGAGFSKADAVGRAVSRLKAHAQALEVPLVLASQVGVPGPDEDPYTVPSRYRMQEAPAAINRQAGYVLMMGPERDGEHVLVELQKAKGARTGAGARVRLRRGRDGRFVRPTTTIDLDGDGDEPHTDDVRE